MKTFLNTLVLLAACVPDVIAAPPTLTSLFPSGGQRGTTVEVTAAGTFERWPVQIWADGQGVEVKAAKDKGKFTVTMKADAVPGVCWMRAYDEQGASTLRPFLVGTLPEVLDQEPNDDYRKPQMLAASTTVNGRLAKSGDVDCFAIKLRKGQPLVASLEANTTLASPMDAVLQVISADGFVLDQNNDCRGLDPQVVFTAPADGTYIARTFAFPSVPDSSIRFAGGETFIYRLTITTGGFAEYAYPLAVERSKPAHLELVGWNIPDAAKKHAVPPGVFLDAPTVFHAQVANGVPVLREPHATAVEAEPNDLKHPRSISLPVTISGRIDPQGDVDVFRFEAVKGQKLAFRLESRSLGFAMDAVLRLSDAAGKTLLQVDDVGSRREGSRDPELAYTVTQDGLHHIEVRDLHSEGGLRYAYRLRAVLAVPDYDLTLATDRFIGTAAKPATIPVTVDRRNGFNEEVEIVAEGLPGNVEAVPVKSLGTGGTAKVVSLVFTGKGEAWSGPVRIIGKVKGKDELTRMAQSPITGFNARTSHVWVGVAKPAPMGDKPGPEKK